MAERDLGKLQLAAWLFPFDVRYRVGPAQLVLNSDDDALAIPILRDAQRQEPYSAVIAAGLMAHMMRAGDQYGASEQFYRLVHVAPNAAVTKAMLATRRDP